MLIGYIRASTAKQNLDLQRDALLHAGCEKIFEEKKSGKAGTKRPEFDAALVYLRPEDVMVVSKLDRFGRSLLEMMRTIDKLRTDNIKLQSIWTAKPPKAGSSCICRARWRNISSTSTVNRACRKFFGLTVC